jgi:hypothetical protein
VTSTLTPKPHPSRLRSRIAQAPITLALLASPLWAAPAQAINPEGLTGPFALNNWKLIASYIDGNNSTAVLDTKSFNDYVCDPSFESSACIDGPDLEGPSPIETTPSGAFTIVGATAVDFTAAANKKFFLNWTLDPVLSARTTDYFVSFNFLYQTGDTAPEIKGYFSINDVLTSIQTSTNNQTSSGIFRITPTDTIAFGVSSSNFDNNQGFVQITGFTADVPGPLPLLGAAAAFGWSRRMRARIKQPKS